MEYQAYVDCKLKICYLMKHKCNVIKVYIYNYIWFCLNLNFVILYRCLWYKVWVTFPTFSTNLRQEIRWWEPTVVIYTSKSNSLLINDFIRETVLLLLWYTKSTFIQLLLFLNLIQVSVFMVWNLVLNLVTSEGTNFQICLFDTIFFNTNWAWSKWSKCCKFCKK